ncbi:MltA-interacting MipA family protein [Dickeya chrysanthemi Ech1591]|uniref:MltA-interacting MipA family protein n=1 Tax=Dickeya chrysanthemi (strain Ech1591) TaxID=561229 RepID=C6CHT9_DICC1|nr:MipA/OmpV family protein [Dickeya chrysanthemi]ACT08046.1 MltA-interacting MipA family protein [Dickeya chrysanthemi Ech1591]WJM84579.1 MipA/OmpV family protein [Dickeya chrysanthemi]
MIVRHRPFYIATLFFAVSNLSWADDTAPGQQDGVTLGLAAHNAPRYSGSDERAWAMLPVIQARQGAFFFDTAKGAGYDLQFGQFYLEHTLGYAPGRTDKKSSFRAGSDKLRGMGNIDGVLNTAVALGWQFTDQLSVEAKAILPLTDSQGVQYQTSLTSILFQDKSDTLGAQGTLLFGDARYNNLFYGVNQQQSQNSGYRTYQAESGLYGQSISLFWTHQFDPHWAATLSGSYTHLNDKAADSPIVFSANQSEGTFAVTYAF